MTSVVPKRPFARFTTPLWTRPAMSSPRDVEMEIAGFGGDWLDMPHPQLRRMASFVGALVLGAVVLALLAAFMVWGTFSPAIARSGLLDMRGQEVDTAAGFAIASADAQIETPTQRLQIPAVDLDVPLIETRSREGVLRAPGFQDAYWVADRGVSPADAQSGTVYVVLPSLPGDGVAPGDYVQDLHDASSSLRRGTLVAVAGRDYEVVAWAAVDKEALPAREEYWAAVPRRLILITEMQQQAGDPPAENLIIVGELAQGE